MLFSLANANGYEANKGVFLEVFMNKERFQINCRGKTGIGEGGR